MSAKKRVWEIVEVAGEGDKVSKVFDLTILSLIALSIAAVVLESVADIRDSCGSLFSNFEVLCVAVFSVEYVMRVWSCTEEPRYDHPLFGRLRFALTPMILIDLLAILPFFLAAAGLDLRFVRALRLLRVFRLAKLARYSRSMRMIGGVFRRAWDDLLVTMIVIGLVAVVAAILMFYAERGAEPAMFPDIPSAIWWAVVTLTTVGYGDAYPVTVIGKSLAILISFLGVGLLAMPTAILGSTFVDELKLRREREVEEDSREAED